MTDKPYEERLGGSYVRETGEAKARLVERTTEPAPAGDAAPAESADAPAETAKKTKRSD